MTHPQDPQDIPESVADWLAELQSEAEDQSQNRGWQLRRRDVEVPQSELQKRAAQCYAMAGWGDDACRMFEVLGDRRHAAPYYEQRGLWLAAADCYRSVGDWSNAARCYRRGDHYDEAAECLVKAGQPIQAAWVWADLAHLYQRAEHTVRQLEVDKQGEQASASLSPRLAIELILARCEVGQGMDGAGRRLRAVMVELAEMPFDFRVQELKQWALAVASELQRPDLTAMLHALAVDAKHPGAAEQWDDWLTSKVGAQGMTVMPEAWD